MCIFSGKNACSGFTRKNLGEMICLATSGAGVFRAHDFGCAHFLFKEGD